MTSLLHHSSHVFKLWKYVLYCSSMSWRALLVVSKINLFKNLPTWGVNVIKPLGFWSIWVLRSLPVLGFMGTTGTKNYFPNWQDIFQDIYCPKGYKFCSEMCHISHIYCLSGCKIIKMISMLFIATKPVYLLYTASQLHNYKHELKTLNAAQHTESIFNSNIYEHLSSCFFPVRRRWGRGGGRGVGKRRGSRKRGVGDEQMNWWPFAVFYRTTAWPGLFSASQKTAVSFWRLMLIRACQQSSL